ncbi:MAG: hypothetical protein A3F46_05090 [Legionellales bacterium RIFCSPHIGHO2_12_FULL_42_9]|nr:MAG: hypothetical protein A3F46_05090 [Legionellales bacterium RIFCSPHIGHO2_12_FULL_42_9]
MRTAQSEHKLINSALYDATFQAAFQSKCITLLAPASGLPHASIDALQKLPGLTVDTSLACITEDILFHACGDEKRFNCLQRALFDETRHPIIWTLRGGYGCARLLDRLAELKPPKHKKVFIGCSDNTALHLFLSQNWHWKTIHASGMAQLLSQDHDPQNYIRIAELVNHSVTQHVIRALSPLNEQAKQVESVTGSMQGGNLTLIENSIGTHWQIQTKGRLLFLEEVGEKGYRIDRSLYHLRQAGLFNQVHGIVFGECLGDDQQGIAVALERFAAETSFPVYQTHQFGHGKINYPIMYGAISEITRASEGHEYVLSMQIHEKG